MSGVVFLDTETTGLDSDRHQIWELALILDGGAHVEFQLPVDLSRADPTGLRVGRFYERRKPLTGLSGTVAGICQSRWDGDEKFSGGLPAAWYAEQVAGLLDGKHLVGAVPDFDARFLTRWLNSHGQAATWHYHLIDVEALALGYVAGSRVHPIPEIVGKLPWRSEDLSRAAGVDPDQFDKHTALGDARWAKALYEAVMGPVCVSS